VNSREALEEANARIAELEEKLRFANLKKDLLKVNRIVVRRRGVDAQIFGVSRYPIVLKYEYLKLLAAALSALIPHLDAGQDEVIFSQVDGKDPVIGLGRPR